MTKVSSARPNYRHPALEMLGRYRAVFVAAWRHRRELAGPALLAHEAAFLPAALSLQHTPVHPAPRRTAFVLMALFVAAVLWAYFGKIDIVAVAPGRIIVSERTKLIQPLERSIVKRVLVKDGDQVAAGQSLVELDTTTASADRTTVEEQLKSAQSEAIRAASLAKALASAPLPGTAGGPDGRIELATFPPGWSGTERKSAQTQLGAEWADLRAKLTRLAAEIARRKAELATVHEVVAKLEVTVPMSRKREEDFKALSNQGFVAGHAGQDRTRERIELERDLSTQRARHLEAQAALAESEAGHAAYLAEARRSLLDRLAQAELKQHQAAQELAKASHRQRLTTLNAPVAGVIQQLSVHTTGGIVTEAQVLMIVVPESGQGEVPVAEVTLENKDIGFVFAGQDAEVKLETFPFTRYGTIPATVVLVTADAVADEKMGAVFPARLSLRQSRINVDGKPIKLSPGMNVTAEIKTGQRRVLDFLLSPIQRAGQESMRER